MSWTGSDFAEAKVNTVDHDGSDNEFEGIGILSVDGRCVVEDCNATAAQMFGHAAPEIVGRDFREFLYWPETGSLAAKRCQKGTRLITARRQGGPSFQLEMTVAEGIAHGKHLIVLSDLQADSAHKVLLRTITEAQTKISSDCEAKEVFEALLSQVLALTESEYGFIGEVLFDAESKPYLKTHAITDISWDEETRRFYQEGAPDGLEFRNLDTLFGAVMVDGRLIVANDPANHPRSGGLPDGHPPLNAFLGLPIFSGDGPVGMVGIANRPGGYDDGLIEFLNPFLVTCGNIVGSLRSRQEAVKFHNSLRESEARGRAILEGAIEAIITIDNKGLIESINPATEKIFGYTIDEVSGRNVSMLMPEPYCSEHDGYLSNYLATGKAKVIGKGREVVGQRKDGSTFPMELAVNHINVGGRDLFTGVIRDITEQKHNAERLRRLNQDLSTRVDELDEVNSINAILNEMGSFFQSVESVDELYGALQKYGVMLFEQETGIFYSAYSHSILENVAHWGAVDGDVDIHATDCWALRRSEVHVIDDPNDHLICPHLRSLNIASSVCVPLIAREGAIGLLTVYAVYGEADQFLSVEERTARTRRNRIALSSVGERFAIAMSNIKLRERLQLESSRDPLTKLSNRRHFDETFEIEFRRSRRTGAPVSLIILDVDHFKKFNDTHGHDAGDEVLRTISEILTAGSRAEDIVCRFGGEEFAIILPACDHANAIKKAAHICEIMSAADFTFKGTDLGRVTVSCGAATIPDHADSIGACIELADKALYKAKETGRNRVVGQSEATVACAGQHCVGVGDGEHAADAVGVER